MSKDIILEVHETANGYSIYCPEKDSKTIDYFGSQCWWGGHYEEWGYKYERKTYLFKWMAIIVAEYLEEKMERKQREAERQRNFVERKVWR